MGASLTILGVRHHGPGSARMVERALETLNPDAVLIEGPPDAADVLAMAAHQDMKPPVALLVFEPDSPRRAAYYPFAEFSPEWRAIRWALAKRRELRFIDLPRSMRVHEEDEDEATVDSQPHAPPVAGTNGQESRADPLEALARAAGFDDGEAWWGRLIEERRGEDDPLAVFDAIRGAMGEQRAAAGPEARDTEEPAREAHMRRSIRTAIKGGFERIAVVCGAWHAPELTSDALARVSSKEDDERLKGLPRRKTAATWIPWTHGRLAMMSGYGAGVLSPGWYEHLWVHHDRFAETWLTRVARFMRDEDLDASPASVIEAVRLAESLAALRGREIAGLDELNEATLAILCHANPLPMRVIERKLIVGEKLGQVPADAPAVPLQRDLAAQQKSLRLKPSADDTVLDLDQRKEMDLGRSRLLHRLCLLDIPWGVIEDDQRRRISTFHEVWRLQWKPELEVAVIDAARFGNTVEEAAAGRVRERARTETELPKLTGLLGHVVLADLPGAVETLLARIQAVSAVSADLAHLMEAVPPLLTVMRYGSVRRTDAELIEPVAAGMLARIGTGLLPACGSLDDEAAFAMSGRMGAIDAALKTLEREDWLSEWTNAVRRVGEADVHGLVAGRCWRLLLDSGRADVSAVAPRLSLALSPGNDPAKAAAWLEGFLSGSGMLLVHDDRLLGLVDDWVTSLPDESFEQAMPLVRRTFATFEKAERRKIGERLSGGRRPDAGAAGAGSDEYDPARGELVTPILRLILGENAV